MMSFDVGGDGDEVGGRDSEEAATTQTSTFNLSSHPLFGSGCAPIFLCIKFQIPSSIRPKHMCAPESENKFALDAFRILALL